MRDFKEDKQRRDAIDTLSKDIEEIWKWCK